MRTKPENENFSIRLSVVVVSVFAERDLWRCLDSILANIIQSEIEIIAACASDESPADSSEKYPTVRFLRFPENTGIPALAAAGIARSAGEIIALTDSSCAVDSNWLKSILEAHQSSFSIIGGAVEAGNRMNLLGWAAYLCDYGQFAHPFKSGAAAVLPGNNLSFKRSALSIGEEYIRGEFWKTLWCQKIRAEGIPLRSEPSILVYYAREFHLVPFLIRRFCHGRCFAGKRAGRMTLLGRTIYVAGSPFLPFVFLYRIAAAVIGKRRFFKKLLLSLPLVAFAVLGWSLGETFGYIAGEAKSCEHIV